MHWSYIFLALNHRNNHNGNLVWYLLTKYCLPCTVNQGTASISNKKSYCKISQSLVTMRFVFRFVQSLYIAGILSVLQLKCISNSKEIKQINYQSCGFKFSPDLLIWHLIRYWISSNNTVMFWFRWMLISILWSSRFYTAFLLKLNLLNWWNA